MVLLTNSNNKHNEDSSLKSSFITITIIVPKSYLRSYLQNTLTLNIC